MDIPEILLVEDRDAAAQLLIDELEVHGLANFIVRVEDGEAALRYLLSVPTARLPALLVLDFDIGALHGLDVLRAIRRIDHLEHLAVIVPTASSDPHDRALADELSVLAFVSKPLDCAKFFAAIRALGEPWALISDARLPNADSGRLRSATA